MFLQDHGFTPEVLARAGATRELLDKYRNFVETLPEDARSIRDYVASAFTDRTDRNYALTAAIAEVHLRSDDVVGVMYPSITRNANADNLALQPSFVDQGLALIAAEALRVRKWNTTDPDAYGIADLAAVERDGRLVWSYTGHELTHVPNQQPSAMLLRPGEILTIQVDANAEIALNGQRYVVNPGYTIRLEDDKITVRDQTGALASPA
jgi:hypothetical protein